MDPERQRLADDAARRANWKRWGPWLADRQWGTVREDYSADGTCWTSFPHDHARSRAYRWGEDGLLGFTDRECRLCLAVALWNGVDPILKERLFGLTGDEGNHGEDVKEVYAHLDATPTASWCRALYRYPLAAYPYERLIAENRRRGRDEREFEIEDTGVFADGRFVDVTATYAKAGPDDVLLELTVVNHSAAAETLHLLPQLWYRNTWIWGCRHEGCTLKPSLRVHDDGLVAGEHESLGRFALRAEAASDGTVPEWLVTENETNTQRLHGVPQYTPYVRDAFHRRVVHGELAAVNATRRGTKAAAWYRLPLPPGGTVTVRLRLRPADLPGPWFEDFAEVLATRRAEADAFYAPLTRGSAEERRVARCAYAGLVWTKQFYHLVVEDWLDGDPGMPPPPAGHATVRNPDWRHLFSRDVLSMPDGWEYPWFAAWDLAFHCIPLARLDPDDAKHQLQLLLREWYLHPNGQLPAYEFAFGDVNPPVHAWAAWRIYRMGAREGRADRVFLERVFQKLLLNFTWWVNRKDVEGRHLFAGGFLGLDNVGAFDRSKPLPGGLRLAQADGTAWMAAYAARMLTIALELARENPVYEDIASKFFEHFVAIADAMNASGGDGLWDEGDGFYHDHLVAPDGAYRPLRIRSIAGLVPLFATVVLRQEHLDRFPGFAKRLAWFTANRGDLSRSIALLDRGGADPDARLLAITPRRRLERVLARVLAEDEFLAPHGVRSLSRAHAAAPFRLELDGQCYEVGYEPDESRSGLFGGNSNWRGPVWFPLNHLLIEALRAHHEFYGDTLTVELPTGSGRRVTLAGAADSLAARLAGLFLPGADGLRPWQGGDRRRADPRWRDLPCFHEFFSGEDGRGCGAAHQTGWTALVTEYLGRSGPA